MKKKTINNTNDKGQDHGYQEYYINNNIMFRAYRKNHIVVGYEELHMTKRTRFNIR